MSYQIFEYRLSDNTKNSICALRASLAPWVKKIASSHSPSNYAPRMYDRANKVSNPDTFFLVCKACGAELYGFDNSVPPYETLYLEQCAQEIERFEPCAATKNLSERARALNNNLQQEISDLQDECTKTCSSPCPICGEPLCPDCGAGFYTTYDVLSYEDLSENERLQDFVFHGHYNDIKSFNLVFDWLKSDRKKEELKAAEEAAEMFAEGCNLIPAIPYRDYSAISKDGAQLKQYISNLIHLENNIYLLKKQLAFLYCHRIDADRAVVFSEKEPIFRQRLKQKELQEQRKKEKEELLRIHEEKLEKLRQAYATAQKNVRTAEQRSPNVSVNYPKPPTEPVYGTPGLFNKKKVLAENEALKAKYEAALESYRQEVKRCDAEKERQLEEQRVRILADLSVCQTRLSEAQASLEAETEKLDALKTRLEAETVPECEVEVVQSQFKPAYAAKELLDKEIAETEDLLKKTFAARNELYAYDIVFGKYRDVVALSSFYEYLMSGRCSSLEGAEGAYNIYENEIRADRVIAQLDTVITSLDEIKQNQYLMYQELHRINDSLDRMNSTLSEALTSIQSMGATMDHIAENSNVIAKNSDVVAKNSKVIAHNTAVTAYYSKVNAELTNALGFMVALK